MFSERLTGCKATKGDTQYTQLGWHPINLLPPQTQAGTQVHCDMNKTHTYACTEEQQKGKPTYISQAGFCQLILTKLCLTSLLASHPAQSHLHNSRVGFSSGHIFLLSLSFLHTPVHFSSILWILWLPRCFTLWNPRAWFASPLNCSSY